MLIRGVINHNQCAIFPSVFPSDVCVNRGAQTRITEYQWARATWGQLKSASLLVIIPLNNEVDPVVLLVILHVTNVLPFQPLVSKNCAEEKNEIVHATPQELDRAVRFCVLTPIACCACCIRRKSVLEVLGFQPAENPVQVLHVQLELLCIGQVRCELVASELRAQFLVRNKGLLQRRVELKTSPKLLVRCKMAIGGGHCRKDAVDRRWS
mmetsp:Transcript_86362/g.185095  ORF Transcript_86362/g.185095 Transcript_86362/m.185095 type:complete len:210 (-) Transcript_86362:835-1464(-)